jgi:phosphoinositide-3-kinase regulatory subunit 4
LTDLGVTPQTVFISPRTVGVDAKADLKRLRPLLGEAQSRRTSMASRSNRGAGDNPVDELRKRLATLDPLVKTPERSRQASEQPVSATSDPPSESAISSTLDLSAMTHTGRKKVDTKGAPAVAAVHTNAIGTTTIHDEPPSGRSTPTIGNTRSAVAGTAPYASSYEGQDPGVRAFLEQVDLENYREPLLDFGPRVLASHRKRAPRPKTTNNPQGVTLIGHLTHHADAIVSIVTSPDQVFFATASQDCTVYIWDSAKLERSIACEPRRSYVLDSPITAMCRIENTHCLAVACEDGQLHVLRVHVATTGGSAKYGKVECIRKWHTEERDGHVTFIAHLQGKSMVLMDADIRIVSLVRYQHIDDREIGYPYDGDNGSVSASP